MIFTETKLNGAFRVDLECREDDRGFFARTWCRREFEEHGLCAEIVQTNMARTNATGTIRGMHYQAAPHAENKLIRCTSGAVFDVIVDLRPESATYTQWVGVELRADNYAMVYVPEGFAHGYQSLEDDSEVVYEVSEFYAPQAEAGARYNDPAFAIDWPIAVTSVSAKDTGWPDYVRQELLSRPGFIQSTRTELRD